MAFQQYICIDISAKFSLYSDKKTLTLTHGERSIIGKWKILEEKLIKSENI